MATEIERKFLVRDESWRAHAAPGIFYRQGYLSSAPTCSIRVRVAGDQAHLNIKSATLGVARTEYEYPIPPEDGREMLATLCRGAVIEKTRYFVEHGRHTWEIDVFEGDNAGLVVAEIELRDTDEPFEYPPWLGREVSDDVRYYNACLVEHPYKEWGSR
jgi:adenylate cyclase